MSQCNAKELVGDSSVSFVASIKAGPNKPLQATCEDARA